MQAGLSLCWSHTPHCWKSHATARMLISLLTPVKMNTKCFNFFVHRSAVIGLKISIDYKWSLWKLDEDSAEYDKAIKLCHKRAAEKLLMGCLNNGGLYVKLGQGLVSMNHILPKEYVETLVILQDKALSMEPPEVRHKHNQEKRHTSRIKSSLRCN